MLTFETGCCKIHLFAEMAELADAHGSGPCGSDTMRVQVPLSALQGGDHKITAFVFPCVQQSWTTLAGVSPVTVIASEPCS